MTSISSFKAASLDLPDGIVKYHPLSQLEQMLGISIQRLPYSLRILLEGSLYHAALNGNDITNLLPITKWMPTSATPRPSISFHPSRVLLQDLTGVPVLVDLASLRAARTRQGEDPRTINPVIPVDLVVDHSLQVDFSGTIDSLKKNQVMEYQRNSERYSFLKWAQQEFTNLQIIPPGSGIVHQVNLEYLARVVQTKTIQGEPWAFMDTLVGTDSHTTMINGLGVLGWGVGGLEAISAMLGQPLELVLPDVVGVRISGQLPAGTMPTDVVLTLTHLLRKLGVVDKLVEFTGPSVPELSVPDRAMLSNMAPEYGATAAYFAVDHNTLTYLQETGRPEGLVRLVETYCRAQNLFREDHGSEPEYSQLVELNLSEIVPSVAGPKRPQDLITLKSVAIEFTKSLTAPKSNQGYGLDKPDSFPPVMVTIKNNVYPIDHGSVILAAITSCTNTSNPTAMIAAGLLAKKAVEAGLSTSPLIKTSFTPGSPVVVEYLQKAGLLYYLEALGFHVDGFGCATCIGNSGPLSAEVVEAITQNHLVGAAVLSGNRNFEGRIHNHIQANFLASPALVVTFALAGSVRTNLYEEPVGVSPLGKDVFLDDIWPTSAEIQDSIRRALHPESFIRNQEKLTRGNLSWSELSAPMGAIYPWDDKSTYLKETPFCDPVEPMRDRISHARVLAMLGDSVTTDHISPAGAISLNSPVAKYLLDKGVPVNEFNTYGSRRGNHEVMARGTFANILIKNKMLSGKEGGLTIHIPDGMEMSIFDAAERYQQEKTPLLIIAGKEYGTGSSRDWAAKGPRMLGVRAIIAGSFERIHRSNLLGMGILPLTFQDGETAESLGLTGFEEFTLVGLDQMTPGSTIQVSAIGKENMVTFQVKVMIHSTYEMECLWKGGVFQS